MRIKHLLYLLLALPLAFVACNDPEEPKPVEKEALLTLTSDKTMEFAAEGGEGVITYKTALREVTRYEPVPEPVVEAVCDAEWVTNLTVAENITFTVLANEEKERETKIVVSYGDKSFEVVVKQVAKPVMDVAMATAERIPSSELDIPENYYALAFADEAENIELGIVLVDEEGKFVLDSGIYTSANDTLLAEACEVFVWEPAAEYTFVEGVATVAFYADNMSEDNSYAGNYKFDITLKDEDGAFYHFTYEGVVADMVLAEKPEAEDFVPVMVEAYREDDWGTGNFELDLYIDADNYHSLDMQDNTYPNNKYLSAGHYSMEDGSITSWSNFLHNIETGEGAYVAAAEIDLSHNEDGTSTLKGYFESEYGKRLNIDWTGVIAGFDFTTEEPSGDVVFNATFFGGSYYNVGNHNYYICLSNMEADGSSVYEGGTYYYFDIYSDEVSDDLTLPNGVYTFDVNNTFASGTFSEEYGYGFLYENGSPNWYLYAEGSTVTVTDGKIVADLILTDGSKQTVIYEGDLALAESLASLDGDLELNETGWSSIAEYYGQWYSNATDNYYVHLYEDIENSNGGYIILDLLADYATSVDHSGTFIGSEGMEINTFMTGYVDDGYLAGTWYTELVDGDVVLSAPIVDGSINVTLNDDGTETYTFDCLDDQGYKITGTVICSPYSSAYALSAQAKAKHGFQIKRSLR